ncbi:MAG: heme o synthase [Thermoplasmata archaeon]
MAATAPTDVIAAPPAAAPRVGGWRDYVTLAKPGITALIVLVAVGGFVFAAPARIDLVRLGWLVLFGAMASAGAAMLNHYLDRDVDGMMRRTRTRPLPQARIDPSARVAVLGLAFSAVGVAGATLALNPLTGVSILLGGFTYVVVYTAWLKRRSSWNIVIGGFAGSAPALAGSAAAVGGWTPGVLAFALLVFLWTPPHFWSLALLLKDDYRAARLPMLPDMDDVAFSARVVVISAALLVPATALVVWLGPVTLPALIALAALGLLFVVLVAPLWRSSERRTARRGFLYSGPYLLGVIGALVANSALLVHGFSPVF